MKPAKENDVILSPRSSAFRNNVAGTKNPIMMRSFASLRMTVLLSVLLAAFFSVMAQAQQSLWAEANTKYQSGDFKGALAAYENVSGSAKETAALDYNLGNVHFRLGHKGKALLFYERALRIRPRDPDILWNIDILKSAVADRIESPSESLIVTWVRTIVDRLTINEISMILSGLLLGWTAIAGLTFIFPMLKPVGRGLGLLILILFLPASVLFGFKWLDVKDPHVVILDREIQARYGPSDRETKAFTLHEGAEAKVADESKDWFYVTLPDKNSGWVPKKSCEII